MAHLYVWDTLLWRDFKEFFETQNQQKIEKNFRQKMCRPKLPYNNDNVGPCAKQRPPLWGKGRGISHFKVNFNFKVLKIFIESVIVIVIVVVVVALDKSKPKSIIESASHTNLCCAKNDGEGGVSQPLRLPRQLTC